MSVPLPNLILPTYVLNSNQENYNQELNQTLQEFFTPNGWQPPRLTTTEATAAAPFLNPGGFWFNTTLGKMQLVNNLNVIETITSV